MAIRPLRDMLGGRPVQPYAQPRPPYPYPDRPRPWPVSGYDFRWDPWAGRWERVWVGYPHARWDYWHPPRWW